MSTTIKLVSESGNVGNVVARFKGLINTLPSLEFKMAEIRTVDHNHSSKLFNKEISFPLRLYTNNGIIIFVSEVCCGEKGPRSDAMLEILRLAKFDIKPSTIEFIYSDSKFKLILWNEDLMKQF